MAGNEVPGSSGAEYSPVTGFMMIFNLIVGTGALTLPSAFHNAGWALSSAVIIVLAFMSYLTVTFVIESMAAANAIIHYRRAKRLKLGEEENSSTSHLSANSAMVRSESQADVSNYAAINPNAEVTALRPSRSALNINAQVEEALSDGEDETTVDFVGVISGNEREPLLASQRRTPSPMIASHSRPATPSNGRRSPEGNSYYEITDLVEMGRMTQLFFNKWGQTAFFVCLAVYLYGDLAIYASAVSKSVRDLVCTASTKLDLTSSGNTSNIQALEEYKALRNASGNDTEHMPCRKNWQSDYDRMFVYRCCLMAFITLASPFTFFDLSKTKYMQIATSVMRWTAFIIMISLASLRLIDGDVYEPDVANWDGIPNLFGVCVYSFMCHHSLPSLVTPISNKKKLSSILLSDYGVILLFYVLLAFTGIFAFAEINDLYTLNFLHKPGEAPGLAFVHYFLSLFPVFTLSTNFPIIAITLRNNLKNLFITDGRAHGFFVKKVLFPLMAIIPPAIVAFVTNQLDVLVGLTGSYAGAGIQYIVPALLVYRARKVTNRTIGVGVKNHHASSFKGKGWILFVCVWAAVCIVLVTWNNLRKAI